MELKEYLVSYLNIYSAIKNFKNTLIAITGNKDSFLGKQSDYVLNAYVEKEACPHNLAPTTSTTAQMLFSDIVGSHFWPRK